MTLLTLLLQQSASLIILGTGTPNPDPERSGPAVAVVVNETAYLVDAGPGVVRRAAAAAAQYSLAALNAERLGIVFLTHLHSDHTVGLPDVIHTGWVAERKSPLQVYGPRGTRQMAEHLTQAWSRDIQVRTEGDQPHTKDGWKVEVQEVSPGTVYRDSNVTVTAIPVPHTNWDQAYAYRFETGGRVFVISGDARPSDAVARACNGCDVLVHEVYSVAGFKTISPAWQRYHSGSHTSTVELGALAQVARPRLLVLYHQLYWGATDADLVREIKDAGYSGDILAASDLVRVP